MDQITKNYAQILYDLNISQVSLNQMHLAIKECPVLLKVLESPVIHLRKKQRIIQQIFPKELYSFLCVLCRHQHAALLPEIYEFYQELVKRKQGILTAQYVCVTMPDEKQLDQIKRFLKEKYHANDVEIQPIRDPKLLGGYVLRVNHAEYDHSYQGLMLQLKQNMTWR